MAILLSKTIPLAKTIPLPKVTPLIENSVLKTAAEPLLLLLRRRLVLWADGEIQVSHGRSYTF
jgi:hypothetical protein